MNRKEVQKELTSLKNNFKNTLLDVAETLDIPVNEVNRDDYVRVTVDFDVANRLNKEELNLIGGYAEAKAEVLVSLGNVKKPKILVLDIETTFLEVRTWGIWNVNVSLNQIIKDWSILSFAAKWYDEDEIFYMYTRNEKDKRNDSKLLIKLHELLNEADFLITHHGKSFDLPKIKARMVKHKMKPFSSVKHIDTKAIASKEFNFTSNKLEYLTHNFCTESKKVINRKFQGMDLWTECLNGNMEAFNDMEVYNKGDITSLEELAKILIPWSSLSINTNLFHSESHNVCFCGSASFKQAGFYYTSVAKYRKLQCTQCGAESRERKNLIKKDKTKKLTVPTQK